MNTSTLQQPDHITTELPQEPITQEQSTFPPWHKPTITRIDIKHTMNSAGGSAGDFTTGHYA